ncbi:MAG: hypothetical protein OER95_01020 [Acidimicrobiia bacterium]|nr:hypothetical protein [Acidimicrobiia bacterium]
MARIKLRPHDLALLAQRFDAASEELRRSARRLEVEPDHVAVNPEDEQFPFARFKDRTTLVQARLRRLSDEFGVDAGLLSAAADGGEFGWDYQWLRSLQVLVSGWDPVASLGSAWTGVARGLVSMVGAIVAPLKSGSPEPVSQVWGGRPDTSPPVMVDDSLAGHSGGLFVTVSAGGDGDVALLGGQFGGLARSDGDRPDPEWSLIWDRISDELPSD